MSRIKEKITLKDYLQSQGFKNNKIKSLLRHQSVYVNDKPGKHDTLLQPGDIVEIRKQTLPFPIIYEDKDIIVIDKPAGLLTERTEREKEKTAYQYVLQYVKQPLYIVQRLDKDTSGLLMFVKNKELYSILTKKWNQYVLKREYIAVVSGKLKKSGRIDEPLWETKSQLVVVNKKGKRSITNYQVLSSHKIYSLIKVLLETGRKNQIRAHMSYIHHPLLGDKKYGHSKAPRLMLHHSGFSFQHPITHKVYTFTSPIPEVFKKYQ